MVHEDLLVDECLDGREKLRLRCCRQRPACPDTGGRMTTSDLSALPCIVTADIRLRSIQT